MSKGYKATASGSGANIMVRHILSNIGDYLGGFSKDQWIYTKKHFDNRCAYTGEEETLTNKLVREHIISHNQNVSGLHIYGNVIPSTSGANTAKHGQTLDEFMVCTNKFFSDKGIGQHDLDKRKEKIIKFQEDSGYTKIHSSLLSVIQTKPNDYYKDLQALVEQQTKEILDIINNSNNDILVEAISKAKNNKPNQTGIAAYVRGELKELVAKNLIDESMLSNLLLKDYSNTTFGISFPFLSKEKIKRYNKNQFDINNEIYYVTSEWNKAKTEALLEKFEKWKNKIMNCPVNR